MRHVEKWTDCFYISKRGKLLCHACSKHAFLPCHVSSVRATCQVHKYQKKQACSPPNNQRFLDMPIANMYEYMTTVEKHREVTKGECVCVLIEASTGTIRTARTGSLALPASTPIFMHRSEPLCTLDAIWGPKNSRFPWPKPLPLARVKDLPASKPLHTAPYKL